MLNIDKCLGKELSRRSNEWLYRFQCTEPGCDNTFAIQRRHIGTHHGMCKAHYTAASKRRRAGLSEEAENGPENFHNATIPV